MSDPIAEFEAERRARVAAYPDKDEWRELSRQWLDTAFREKYMYNFSWAGRPVIQLPADMVAFQEIVWATRPDAILETGIAHGGSLMLSASMLALLDVCDALEAGAAFDPAKSRRRVVGVDIDIRAHNRAAIEAHPLARYLTLVEGSSLDPGTVALARSALAGAKRVMVCLDSNHTHEHVRAELELYAPLTSRGCYCLVFDTIVEDLAPDMFPDRPWAPGDNPKTAVREFLRLLETEGRRGVDGAALDFSVDREIEDKLLLSVAPEGVLRRA